MIHLTFRNLAWFTAALLLEISASAASVQHSPEQVAFFEERIRPILAEHCYKCHSVEEGKAKGGLTMDSREALRKGGESGEVIEPGAPGSSLLIQAVNYLDPDLQMPPKGEKLAAQQIADLTEWVKMGAPDPRSASAETAAKLSGLTDKARSHWAYQPVVKPAVPKPQNQAWPRTLVDSFILEKLEANRMIPAPDADRETLLRRATYDLIGLPPSPQEVADFLADQSKDAFAKVIDRLLASPHYGERWGRFWLDTARYSDTIGGDRNLQRRGLDYRYPYAWTYRDYVIRAFNEDKPYTEFIKEQIAADLLPNTAPDRLAALGFLTVGERFRNPNDIINDRIDVVSKGFLGMTVSCARCHDHMFDPIPTEDYYALHGVFASTMEPAEKPIISSPREDQLALFQKELTRLEAQNRSAYYRLADRVTGEFQKSVEGYLLAARTGGKKARSPEVIKERNGIVSEYGLDRELLQLIARNGRRGAGYFAVFTPFRRLAELSEAEFADKAPKLVEELTSESRPRLNRLVVEAFKGAQPRSLKDVAAIYQKLFASLEPQRRAYLEASAKALNEPVKGFPPEILQLINLPFPVESAKALGTAALRAAITDIPPKILGQAGFVFAQINELELTHPGAPARPMLVSDTTKPRDSRVFIRGMAENKGAVVPRHFLTVLTGGSSTPFTEGSGRRELAEAIASKENPLTARVLVNRVWMHHFGSGFVPTPDDLGTQSEAPSHPELVDYLAATFMEQGWSIKKLHRLIMLSRVYHESSQTRHEFEQLDPENRLLWRANIRRLDFESTRDSLLAFSGNLDRSIGGQPVNLTDEPYSFRRSVYGYIDRGNLPELMQHFDFSDPDMPNSKRGTTVVPQQALFLMNSPMAIDVARRLIARPEVATASDNLGRIFALYRVIFQRTPRPQEIQMALSFVGTEVRNPVVAQEVEEPTADPRPLRARLKRVGMNGRYAGMKPIQNPGQKVARAPLTPWETYAQALLFTNEASYVN